MVFCYNGETINKANCSDEEAYEEWTAELSAYGEDAFAILEAYDELTEEQQAQIPGEAVARQMAWAELADMIKDGQWSSEQIKEIHLPVLP